MTFTIDRHELEKAIQRVLAVVSPKTTLPVLANFLLEAQEKSASITLTATDLDMTVTTKAASEVESGGSVTLPAKRFAEIVRELGTDTVSVSAEGEEISITSGKSRFKIVGIPTEEFPTLPKSDPASAFSVDASVLGSMVEKVSFCTSKDETRPSLNGAYWEFSADDMRMTATDGHRLATYRVGGKYKPLAGKSMIVPPKALSQVVRTISSEDEDEVKLSVKDNHVAFFIGSTTINSRLLEGPFPNYRQVIPTDNDKELSVDREELVAAVRRVAILADAMTHQVRLTLAKNKVQLSVSTPDVGEAKEELPGRFTSDKFEVGYNANYVLEVLKHIEGDDVLFVLGSPVGAAIVKAAEEAEDREYTCLLMPLRLSS
ncbi:MAG: DNA polymerase III subunit beta [Candidatus Eisenbacteria bacterium]|nr:DNA polymerase III subunit beta [Candidatus Eisenbacteria bacterium]